MQRPNALFGLSPQNFSLIFFLKKSDLKKFLIFSQKSYSNFQETELSYTQNHSMFRTRGIFRTLSNIYDGMFCKNSYVAHLSAILLKLFLWKFLLFSEKNASPPNLPVPTIFRKQDFSYILGKAYSAPWHNATFLIFQERNIQNPGKTERSYISGSGAF